MDASFYLMLYFVVLDLLFPASSGTNFTMNYTEGTDINGRIGAILDCTSKIGKKERVAMEIALEDLNKLQKNQRLSLHVKCSSGDPVQAAQAARHLMNQNHVQAILGPNSWDESSAVAEVVGQQFNSVIPILSLSDSTPPWATTHWPFLIQASPSTSKQMKAVAAIIKSWEWVQVNVLYQDSYSDILSHLHEAFHNADIQINAMVPLPSFASPGSLHEELQKLKNGPCRIYVVHTGLALAERVFQKAQEMKMEKDYVWITTDPASSMMDYSVYKSKQGMRGVLGLRRYVKPNLGQDYFDFEVKYFKNFRQKYPGEKILFPGLLALQAYDVTSILGSTINAGQQILENFQDKDWDGLSGKIQFKDRKLAPIHKFQIINVLGKIKYQHLGFWCEGLGFSIVIGNREVYNFSMKILGNVVWPGWPYSISPGRWILPTVHNPLKIAVPVESLTNIFVKVEYDPSTNNYNFSGFSIEVFGKAVHSLKYHLPYQFIPFWGDYTDLVKQVQLKKFDAAVGDIAIVSNRYDYVEFTHAHAESGVVMVVLNIESHPNRAWLFLKPFTKAMWLLTGFINLYNGFVIWSIERNYRPELRGSLLSQIGSLLWLAFATVFSIYGERLHSNLSKMAMIVWLFATLIIIQSYIARLASMLTVPRIEPKYKNIETLKSENAYIGYSKRSFVKGFLEEALGFHPNNIKNFTTTDAYAEALRSGEISAAFLESPVAKLFVDKYCKSFTIAGPTFKVGGYGFAFPKRSLLLPDLDEALLRLFESGELKLFEKRVLEKSSIASEECVQTQAADNDDSTSLGPRRFFVLFIFTGSVSTASLAIYYFRRKREVVGNSNMGEHNRIWMLIAMVLNKSRYQRRD